MMAPRLLMTACCLLMLGGLFVPDGSAATAQLPRHDSRKKLPYTWVFVTDMHCGACAKKIARKLYAVPGVVKVQTSVKKSVAVVTPQKTRQVAPRAVWEAVEKAGFKPVKLVGPAGTYRAKPPRVATRGRAVQ